MDGVQTIEIPGVWSQGASAAETRRLVLGAENELLLPPLGRLLDPDSIANAPDRAQLFNPLVLVGASGLGKSELLRSVVRSWRERFGEQAVGFYNVVDFGRDAQAAHSRGTTAPWRRMIGNVRLLAVDDLHRLRARESIRAELRFAIDSVVSSGGLVVVTSQLEPAALSTLDASLCDRFASGLLVRLQWPGRAARRALLTNEATRRSLHVSTDQIERLADRLDGPPARVAGALDALDCREVSRCEPPANDPTLKQIIAVACRYFQITQPMMTGKSRRRSSVFARSIVVHLARRLTSHSYAQIGAALGGRDHTTVMHADRTAAEMASHDPKTQLALEELERILRAN